MLARRLRQGSVYLHGRNRSQEKAVTCRHLDSKRSPAPTEIERLLASTDTSATTNQIQICGFLLQVSKTLQACSIQNAIQEYAILRQRRVTFARGSAGSVFGREGGREGGREECSDWLFLVEALVSEPVPPPSPPSIPLPPCSIRPGLKKLFICLGCCLCPGKKDRFGSN